MFVKSRQHKTLEDLSDQEIIRRYQKTGDNRMIDVLFARYSHLIYGVALKFLKNSDESKDIVMVVFDKLVELLKHETVDKFNSWIFILTRNSCFSVMRKNKNIASEKEIFIENEKSTEIFMENEGFTRLYNREADGNQLDVDSAMKQLNKMQQKCIKLFYFKKLRYQEIAEQLNLSVNEVKSNLQNGKRNLKIILTQSYST